MPVIGADIHCCTGSPETRCLHRQSHDDGSQSEDKPTLCFILELLNSSHQSVNTQFNSLHFCSSIPGIKKSQTAQTVQQIQSVISAWLW